MNGLASQTGDFCMVWIDQKSERWLSFVVDVIAAAVLYAACSLHSEMSYRRIRK